MDYPTSSLFMVQGWDWWAGEITKGGAYIPSFIQPPDRVKGHFHPTYQLCQFLPIPWVSCFQGQKSGMVTDVRGQSSLQGLDA